MAKLIAGTGKLRLDEDLWEWLESWPPQTTPMPANEPGATEREGTLYWNHFSIEEPALIPAECADDDASWRYGCVWSSIREGVLDGQVEVVPGQDHTFGEPFDRDFARCDGSCRTIPAPEKWRVAKYGENYQEHYK
jgi:hypothetical protein